MFSSKVKDIKWNPRFVSQMDGLWHILYAVSAAVNTMVWWCSLHSDCRPSAGLTVDSERLSSDHTEELFSSVLCTMSVNPQKT